MAFAHFYEAEKRSLQARLDLFAAIAADADEHDVPVREVVLEHFKRGSGYLADEYPCTRRGIDKMVSDVTAYRDAARHAQGMGN